MTDHWENAYAWKFAAPSWPVVEISDGVETYCRSLRPGETVTGAALDFARSYDLNDNPEGVDCEARLWMSPPHPGERYGGEVVKFRIEKGDSDG